MNNNDVEFWEKEYLEKIVYLLKIDEEKMFRGFQTKEEIRSDWEKFLGNETSEFAVGAERVFYWLFNQFGVPNSSPIGSDLFFETYNAYIHIDIKTVTLANLGDYTSNIFVGNNQVSYASDIIKNTGTSETYVPHLPHFYNKTEDGKKIKKMCLTYFITILYDENTLKIHNIAVMCVPNGSLEKEYKNSVYNAGKNPGKARFNFRKCSKFKLVEGSRVVSLFNDFNVEEYVNSDKNKEKKTPLTEESFNKKMKFWMNL